LLHHTVTLQDGSSSAKKSSVYGLKRRAIQQADIIIAFSDADQQWIKQSLSKKNQEVKMLWPRVVEIAELEWTEKELVKNEFSGGVEYFLFAGDLHERYDLIGLLKAFSVFKKWQHSNMALVIAGNKTAWTETFSQQLATFKFRKDVYLMVNPPGDDLRKIIAGAYAFVYPAINDNFPINILVAMQAGIPVISSSFAVSKEWCGDAVMFPETNDSAGFAKSMQLIYKDELLRSAFINAARLRLSTRNKTDMAEACLNFFEETIAK
jgi:glycosyltransferase involved in cell wall biosynthesis